MRVRIAEIGSGQHFSEKVVMIETVEGSEELLVDGGSIREQSLDVGYPVGQQNGHFLVQLPRETSRGARRVWIDQGIVVG